MTSIISRWFGAMQRNPAAPIRLFSFHYAGGSAAIFRSWRQLLPNWVELWPVQFPGRGQRISERPETSIERLVGSMLPDLLPIFKERPFCLFGHSMGATVAFELARKLFCEHGSGPCILFVSGRRAPNLSRRKHSAYKLSDPDFVDELRRLNGTPREVLDSPELMQLLLPVIKADFEAIETYRYMPGEPLACPIVAFAGLHDGEVRMEEMEPWRSFTSADFSLQTFEGDHFFIHSHEALLTQEITTELRLLLQKPSWAEQQLCMDGLQQHSVQR